MGYLDDAFLFHDPVLNIILVHPEASFALCFSGWSSKKNVTSSMQGIMQRVLKGVKTKDGTRGTKLCHAHPSDHHTGCLNNEALRQGCQNGLEENTGDMVYKCANIVVLLYCSV